ncbi:1-hydroxycarotenoid 3,4-desaturase [Neolewinella maritima]|uniref:1-hydroxycarotenoid 3,4-desaturase n=1 Tax=Neolewinella maritima TaxID=1383882 RepID=A0ABN8F9X2_9BACT|nr:1-hydroxycarotenoid 3,4-desaturase CrtD [Neolewinella maritima]CAH1001273.1 1-hydroxycarotenoid 3,4-desaturase [Neolewinella maritima]
MKTAVIGAGIAGLAAAVRLAVAGHTVDVYETNAGPGGKLNQFSLPGGYRFDFGPSLFTMPQYVDELFTLAGEDPRDHFNYTRLPEVCRYWWPDGTRFTAPASTEDLVRQVAQTFDVPEQAMRDFMDTAARKYTLTGRTFLEKSLHKVSTWLDPQVAYAMLKIPGLDLFRSMHDVHEAALGDPRLVQLFDRFATYNGSNPYKAPGLLSMIPHFEHHFGAYLPAGGMYDIARSVHALGERLGVRYHFGTRVEQILLPSPMERGRGRGQAGSRVQGIQVNGEEVAYDTVVCNMDVWLAYDRLLSGAKRPAITLKQQKSSSAVIFYWGIDRSFPELGLHNIFFSKDYAREFASLEGGTLSDDVTVYVNISSKYVPEDAPAGHENWFVMVNAPAHTGHDWDTLVAALRQQIIAMLSAQLAPSADTPDWLARHITAERIVTPPDIESLTGSHQGALYGSSSNGRMAAFLRHPNFSRRIDGLYFLGGSVHPGGGLPLCLLSARIVADLVADANKSATKHAPVGTGSRR